MDADEVIERHRARIRHRLPATILPYWLTASRDDEAGGYLLPDDVVRSPARHVARRLLGRAGPGVPEHKQLVTQARLLWVFSTAHRRGYGTDGEYLDAAVRGYQFLLEHFRDPDAGGYAWSTDRYGTPTNVVKHLYGQAFVVYAFVEYARASGDREALEHARAVHDVVDDELHDDTHGGWREHGDDHWRPVAADDRRVRVPAAGTKTGNTLLHWVEALSALCTETTDARVRGSLAEALALCRRHCYPADPSRAWPQYRPDWTCDPLLAPTVSYGHNVEFVWLMIRAQRVLGLEPAHDQFHRYLDHALRLGFDAERGGVFTSGRADQPADERYKVWWVQCEMICALLDALEQRPDDRYAVALARTLTFVERHMTDRRDGVLLEAVEEDGRRRRPRKSGDWKAGYHDVRAALRLVEGGAPS